MDSTRYLPVLYLILILLSFFSILPSSVLIYSIAAVVIAILFLIAREEKEIKLSKYFLILAFLIILIPKVIPYLDNSIPLGYDAGIYKYGIEHSLTEEWTKSTFTPIFNLLTKSLNLVFSTSLILTFFVILFELLLGFSIYLTVKEYFDKNTAILSTLLFSLSIVQFNAFTLLYYKNIIAMSFLLFSFYFLKKQKYIIFTIFSVITAGIHKPTFLLLAISFLTHTILNYKENLKKNIISGITIIILTLLIYLGRIKSVILPGITESIGLAIGPGTFISLAAYKVLILIYIPFLTIGLYHVIHNKKFNILFFWFIVNFIIVVFRLFFFNRYIIMLDLIVLIIVAIGLLEILKDNRIIGIITVLIIFGFLSYNVIGESLTVKPLITQDELDEIKELQNTENEAFVMATHSNYAPWILGYSERKTIAPGLFEYNVWNQEQWREFWSSDAEKAKEMLEDYERPLYIHVGDTKGKMNVTKFEDECFESFNEKVLKVNC